MPRNVTVTLADGTQHVYANTPDTVTPDQVSARAQRDFNQPVKAIDGGKAANSSGLQVTTIPAARMNNIIADATAGRPYTPPTPAQRQQITTRPVQVRPTPAPAPPQQSQTANIAADAQQNAQQEGQSAGNFGTAFAAGIRRGLFGIPERLAAAGEAYLPSSITGNTSNASYNDILNTIRARTDAELGLSTPGNIAGQVVSAVGGGRAVAGALGNIASRAQAAAAPIVQKAGNILQELTTLRQGQTAANLGKVALAGGAGGGAQAAGEGSDIPTGIGTGLVAAPLLHGGASLVSKFLLQPVATALRLPSAQAILRNVTGANAEEIAQNAADFKARTGAEPTIFEALPLADREKIKGLMQRMPAGPREQAAALVRDRAAAIGPEMAARSSEAVAPQVSTITDQMGNDLAASKGAPAPAPEDVQAAQAAVAAPVDMKALQAVEASNIMAPHDTAVVTNRIADLLPQEPVRTGPGSIQFQETDPEVSQLINSVAGPRRLGNDITVRDVTGMISKLKGIMPNAGIQQPAVQRAIAHLEDQLPPDARAAYNQMTQAFAGRGRMLEGVTEGSRSRVRQDIPVETSGQRLDVTNAYDTPEGTQGRVIGQAAQLRRNLTAAPASALAATTDIASNPATQQALGGNLGLRTASNIVDAATAQAESARRLSGLSNEVSSQGTTDNMTLAHALITLNPKSMLISKANALQRLSHIFAGLPERQSSQIVDALFSRNPTSISRGMKMLNNMGDRGKQAISTLANAMASGNLATQAVSGNLDGSQELPPDTLTPISDALPPPPGATETAAPGETPVSGEANPAGYPATPEAPAQSNLPYAHRVISSLFPGIHVSEDVRAPDSKLGRENPSSYHVRTQNAVDVRPIPGMSFKDFTDRIQQAGYKIMEAIDEVNHPSRFATGKHWHVVIAGE